MKKKKTLSRKLIIYNFLIFKKKDNIQELKNIRVKLKNEV